MTKLETRRLKDGEPLPLRDPLRWLDIRLVSALYWQDDDTEAADDGGDAKIALRIIEPREVPPSWSLRLGGPEVRFYPGLEEPAVITGWMEVTGQLSFNPGGVPFTEFLLYIKVPVTNRPEALLSIVLAGKRRQELRIHIVGIQDGFIEYTLEQAEPEDV